MKKAMELMGQVLPSPDPSTSAACVCSENHEAEMELRESSWCELTAASGETTPRRLYIPPNPGSKAMSRAFPSLPTASEQGHGVVP